jgi:methyl-accepting chemotaxis protein
MHAKSRYTLQRTMILYFLLIGIASCMVGIEFLVDFNTEYDKIELREGSSPNTQDQDAVLAFFDLMRKKAVVMVVIIMVVTLIVLTMFIKNISEPLQHMIDNTHKILSGDLSRTIKIQSDNELSKLGNIINDLSSNLQEILLLSRGLCTAGQNLIDETMQQLQKGPLDSQDQARVSDIVQRLSSEFASMNQAIDYFNFYTGENQNHAG